MSDWMSASTIVGMLLTVYLKMLPAMVANSSAVIFGGGPPIDNGAKFFDSQPIFGKNKTIRGFVGGVVVGGIVGLLLSQGYWGFILALGALLGDLVGAFIKRRFKVEPGQPFPLLDQYDFVIGAFVVSELFNPVDLTEFLLFFLTIPLVHLGANIIAYKLGLKRVPW